MLNRNVKRFFIAGLLLVAVLLCAAAAQADYDGVTYKLNKLRTMFPGGKYWNHYIDESLVGYDAYYNKDDSWKDSLTDSPCNHNANLEGNYDCNYFDGASQCYGFANRVFYEVFGLKCTKMKARYDMENVMPGDHVRSASWDSEYGGHSAIVIARNGNKLTLVECNYDYHCEISWGRVADISEFVTFKRASNWDEINQSHVDQVPVNEEYFPDPIFREIVGRIYDTDKDGILSTEERESVKNFPCFGAEISSLKGIEFFTEIRELDCEYNNLTSLDLSHNTRLEKLNCGHNKLESLNVSKNPELAYITCRINNLSSLDVSNNPALTTLQCYSNNLSSLDVSHNPKLNNLECQDNRFSALDIRKNTRLGMLNCSENRISSLNLNNNTKLFVLKCQGNNITSLNVTNTQLKDDVQKGRRATLDEGYDVFIEGGYTFFSLDSSVTVYAGVVVSKPKATDVTYKGLKYSVLGSEATFTGLTDEEADSLTIPDTITYNGKKYKVTKIKANACKSSKIRKLKIGGNVKTIGKKAFYNCSKLKTVTGGKALVTIEASAFAKCSKLEAFTLREKVKTVGGKAFWKCKNMNTLIVRTSKLTDQTVGADAFNTETATTYKCPSLKLQNYKKLFPKKGAHKDSKYKTLQ